MSSRSAPQAPVSSTGSTPCTVTPGVSGSVASPMPSRTAPRSSRNRSASGTSRNTAFARPPWRTSVMCSTPGVIRLSMLSTRAVPLALPKGGGRSSETPARSVAMRSLTGVPPPARGMSRIARQAASPWSRAGSAESPGSGTSTRLASWRYAASRPRVTRPSIDRRVVFADSGDTPMTVRIGSPSQVAVIPSDSTAAPRNAITPFTASGPRLSPGTSIRLSSSVILPSTVIDLSFPFTGSVSPRSMVLSPCIAKVSIIGVNRARNGLSARKRTALALVPSTRPATCTTGAAALRSSMVILASRTFESKMRPDATCASSRGPSNRTTPDTSVISGQPRA